MNIHESYNIVFIISSDIFEYSDDVLYNIMVYRAGRVGIYLLYDLQFFISFAKSSFQIVNRASVIQLRRLGVINGSRRRSATNLNKWDNLSDVSLPRVVLLLVGK